MGVAEKSVIHNVFYKSVAEIKNLFKASLSILIRDHLKSLECYAKNVDCLAVSTMKINPNSLCEGSFEKASLM